MTDKPLEFHPLADIKANGLQEQIMLYEGKILDGRNRYRACLKAKVPEMLGTAFDPFEGNDDDARAYVISKNIRRRHLTPELKRNLITELLKATPEKTDRQIGKQVGAHHTTVGTIRKAGERRGEISHVEKRTDTKGRSQPATRKGKADKPGANALAWKNPRSRGMKTNEDSIRAKTSDGYYTVYKTVREGRYSVSYFPTNLQAGGGRFLAQDIASLEDAKAVAQADYERGKPAPAAAPAAETNAVDPETSATNLKGQFAALVEPTLSKPLGKREAKRLAKEQRAEAMGNKGEELAKRWIAHDREAARLLADIMSDPDSQEAFEQILAGEFGRITCDDNGKFIAFGETGRVPGRFDSWLEASHAVDAFKKDKSKS
jgi:hypothetical protein